MRVALGNTNIYAVPAHFLHAEGNFQFYDERSKILFSGDMGASLVHHDEVLTPIRTKAEFAVNLKHMEGFHKRYMVSNKVLRLWVNMARKLDISMLVPQHGAPITGPAIAEFFTWAENLYCGVDLFDEQNYQLPSARLAM